MDDSIFRPSPPKTNLIDQLTPPPTVTPSFATCLSAGLFDGGLGTLTGRFLGPVPNNMFAHSFKQHVVQVHVGYSQLLQANLNLLLRLTLTIGWTPTSRRFRLCGMSLAGNHHDLNPHWVLVECKT